MTIFKVLPSKLDLTSTEVNKITDDTGDFDLVTYTDNKPTYANNAISFLRANANAMQVQNDIPAPLITQTQVPDKAANNDPAGGWTITGIDRIPVSATYPSGGWLCANHGKTDGSQVNWYTSLVVMSADRTSIIAEFPMTDAALAGDGSIQDVAVDTSDGTWYVAATQAGKILHLAEDGTKLGEIAAASVNLLGYDVTRDGLWWAAAGVSTLNFYDLATSTQTNTMKITAAGDMISITADGYMFISVGANGTDGSVYVYDTQTELPCGRITGLQNCQSIEGIHYDSATKVLTIANDGAFHTEAVPTLNLTFTYDASALVLSRSDFLGVHGMLTLTGSNPSNRECIMGHEIAESGGAGGDGGWTVYVMSSGNLRFQIRSKTNPDQIFLREYAVSRAAEFSYSFFLDRNAGTFGCEINGVTATSIGTSLGVVADLVDDFNTHFFSIGQQVKTGGAGFAPASFDLKQLAVSTTPSEYATLSTDIQNQPNSAPVADAGANQTATGSGSTTFDGSASVDPDIGDSLSYQWTIVESGTGATLTNATGEIVTVNYPNTTQVVTLQLEVLDDKNPSLSDTATATLTVTAVNNVPSVTISGATTALNRAGVGLTTTVTDADVSDTHTYAVRISDDVSGTATLSSTASANFTVTGPTIDTAQDVTIGVIATDNNGAPSTEVFHTITFSAKANDKPIASISGATTGAASQTITLTSAITDADTEDTHTYTWRKVSGSATLPADLTTSSLVVTGPSLSSSEATQLGLIVNDGTEDSDEALHTITFAAVTSTVSLTITGTPNADYTVTFLNSAKTAILDTQTDVNFTGGNATITLDGIAASTDYKAVIFTDTHVFGYVGTTE